MLFEHFRVSLFTVSGEGTQKGQWEPCLRFYSWKLHVILLVLDYSKI
jgi:hypothetical protein